MNASSTAEFSSVPALVPPPPLRAIKVTISPLIAGIIKVTISYNKHHIVTETHRNMHTNKHTCITVIMVFSGYFWGPNFSCAAPLIFATLFILSCSGCWHGGISHLDQASIVVLMALYSKRVPPPGARCLLELLGFVTTQPI